MRKVVFFITLIAALIGCKSKEDNNNSSQQDSLKVKPVRVIAIGRVEPELKLIPIGTEVGGIVNRIITHASDTVKKGDLLLELIHDYEEAKLTQIVSQKVTQVNELEGIKAQIGSARIKRDNLKGVFERLQRLLDQKAEIKQNVENAKANLDQAEKEIDRLNATLKTAESRIAELDADANLAKVEIERRKIKAPADGVVLNMDLTEGSAANTLKPLFDFAPTSALSVLCEVDELWTDKLSLGQKAEVRTQGTDKVLANGEVVYLSPYLKRKSLFSDESGNMEDRRVREVRIRLNGSPNLLINSRVEAVIALDRTK